ncbi:hypothetical protein EC991_010113, partial [Linnemannia zychae]
ERLKTCIPLPENAPFVALQELIHSLDPSLMNDIADNAPLSLLSLLPTTSIELPRTE